MTEQERAAQRLVRVAPAEGEGQQRVANLWLDAWHRLVRNRAAVLGGVLILVLILAVLAGLVSWKMIQNRQTGENTPTTAPDSP